MNEGASLDIQLFLIAVFQQKSGSYRAYLMDDETTFSEANNPYQAIRGLVSRMESEDYHENSYQGELRKFDPKSKEALYRNQPIDEDEGKGGDPYAADRKDSL